MQNPAREGVHTLGWFGDIEEIPLENDSSRTVVYKDEYTQLTLLRLVALDA